MIEAVLLNRLDWKGCAFSSSFRRYIEDGLHAFVRTEDDRHAFRLLFVIVVCVCV